MSLSLYGRQVRIEVGLAGLPARACQGLHTTFDVQLGVARTPNKARVEIYNLTEDSAAACQQDEAIVRVLAGYGTPALIFSGDIDRAVRERRGPDRVTVIEATDTGRKFRAARIAKSFAAQVTLRQVLTELAAAAGLPLGPIGNLGETVVTQGLVLVGPVRDVLDRVAAIAGADWSLQDGQIVLLGPGEDTGELAVDLGPDSGLVGSPAPVRDAQHREQGLDVTALLQPAIRPGRRFRLRSDAYTGIYRCDQVQHTGDSWGGDFYSKIRARAAA